VGDGVVVLDRAMRRGVRLAQRGVRAAPHGRARQHRGHAPGRAGPRRRADARRLHRGKPITQEVERGEVIILLRCIPMLDSQGVSGAVVLFRDVTEVRQRDRLLLSKDATIREIHHRVKNNLQTISSLLQLQARRTGSDEAKAAIAESVRRIQSIALVHETLSREAGDDVAFTEILRPLVQMVAETVSSPDRYIDFEVEGEAGTLPARSPRPWRSCSPSSSRTPPTTPSPPIRCADWEPDRVKVGRAARRVRVVVRHRQRRGGARGVQREPPPRASACRSCGRWSPRTWGAPSTSSEPPHGTGTHRGGAACMSDRRRGTRSRS
jgi:hypothetical protein